jgi:SulP family sulfate permease
MSASRLPAAAPFPPLNVNLCSALRQSLRAGYTLRDFRGDLMAGIIVGVVALPLSMALAIASGVPPQYGLYTAIVAGAVIAVLGGSPVQVSGPTAAFVVVLAPVAAKFGLAGLLVATLLAGLLQITMGVTRLGRFIEFVPYPVTTGFTAGIAIVIATLQMRDFLGLTIAHMPDHYIERVHTLATHLYTVHWPDVTVGLITLTVLLLGPKITRRVPSPLLALPIAAGAAILFDHLWPGFHAVTIFDRFQGIPQKAPLFWLPWDMPGPAGAELVWNTATLRALVVAAFTIAMLGSIESLLSAVVAAGMSGKEHNPDGELVAQGIGNVVAPFFGGFAATGAIARTATNIRAGARSPMAAVFHAAFLLAAVLLLAPALGYLPMAALAALLLVVAWNMSELKHVIHVLRVAPASDIVVLLSCLGLTVIFDMTVAVTVGVVLAALLFMKRMAAVTGARLVSERPAALPESLPSRVLVYEVAGPLFFGAAQKAMSTLKAVDGDVSIVLLDLRAVPVMDATGLVNLESTLDRLHKAQIYTVLAGVQKQPLQLMAKAGWRHRDWLSIYASYEHGVSVARDLAQLMTRGTPTPPERLT